MNIKQVIVVRKDLKMRRGKEVAQGAHAATAWLLERLHCQYDGPPWKGEQCKAVFSPIELLWINGDKRKITLQVDSEAELIALYDAAKAAALEVYMITDLGLTEFRGVPTKTCLAIGPDLDDKIDLVTRHLKIY